MHIERTRTITISARSDAQARQHVERFMPLPDARWQGKVTRVSGRGTQRTVTVLLTLDKAD